MGEASVQPDSEFDVDESGYFDDLDAVYEQGERVLAEFLLEIEESLLACNLAEAEQTAADSDEFIAVRKWLLDGRVLTAGVVQQDTDLLVMVVTALENPRPCPRDGVPPKPFVC
ncbi:hypothetical protein [Streptomyces sp. NBC_01619]|uniref:hypothetical protein n=1 Tax=Streptomyces sp. NBC_01619 TaxID=2975901 RepID=UPI002B1CDEB6|nr:hypothetical protein [Streptomyces sp. NBC_01619]